MRAIGKIKQIVEEATGLDVSHIYDDIVFVEMSAFIIQFNDRDFGHFFVYFSTECESSSRRELMDALTAAARKNRMRCSDAGDFAFREAAGKDEVEITFYETQLV